MEKPGRPKLDNQHARRRSVEVRLTEAERLALLERSTAEGFASVSEFIRTVALRRRTPSPQSVTVAGVFSADDRRALVNVGNNLNQIARAIHAGQAVDGSADLAGVIADLQTIFDRYLPK